MSLLSNIRIFIRDNESVKRYTDDELTAIIQYSIDDVNSWAETDYTLAQYDATPSSVPTKFFQLVFLTCRLNVCNIDLEDPIKYAKFVTQDTSYDSENTAKVLNLMAKQLQKDLDTKLKKWIGLDFSGVLSCKSSYNSGA